MTLRECKPTLGSVAELTAAVVFGTLVISSPRVRADSRQTDSRIQIGYEIAPVELNLKGLNPAPVGIGSYIVNAQRLQRPRKEPLFTGTHSLGSFRAAHSVP